MRKLITAIFLVVWIVLTALPPVSAITYGVPDEGEHPNVGALVYVYQGEYYSYCSGVLIAPQLFLTAAHCGDANPRVLVSFEDHIVDTTAPYSGTFIAHPNYPGPQSNTYDVAVVLLDSAPPNMVYAKLPAIGQFDSLKQENKKQPFTSVGYGVGEPVPTPHEGIVNNPEAYRVRYMSVGSLNAVNPAWLHLSQNIATDDGGTCYGDSGGPNFLGAYAGPTATVAGVTVTGDMICRATNVIYRLDTPWVHEFLAEYLP